MKESQKVQLEAWFDGELNPAESSEMERLLELDPEARQYLEDLRGVRSALEKAHEKEAIPAGAWDRVEEGITSPQRTVSRKTISFPALAAISAAVILIGMALWWPLREVGMRPGNEQVAFESTVEMVETDLEGATPVVYLDQPSGWTVIWVVEAPPPS